MTDSAGSIIARLQDAPCELQCAIRQFFPENEWDNASAIANLESGFNAFALNDTASQYGGCGAVIAERNGGHRAYAVGKSRLECLVFQRSSARTSVRYATLACLNMSCRHSWQMRPKGLFGPVRINAAVLGSGVDSVHISHLKPHARVVPTILIAI